MPTAATRDYPHIVRTPGVRGGKACIEGTRIWVGDIALLAKRGLRAEEMLEHYSSRPLKLAEVHAALAYYYDHADEIEAELASTKAAATELQEYLTTRAAR